MSQKQYFIDEHGRASIPLTRSIFEMPCCTASILAGHWQQVTTRSCPSLGSASHIFFHFNRHLCLCLRSLITWQETEGDDSKSGAHERSPDMLGKYKKQIRWIYASPFFAVYSIGTSSSHTEATHALVWTITSQICPSFRAVCCRHGTFHTKANSMIRSPQLLSPRSITFDR